MKIIDVTLLLTEEIRKVVFLGDSNVGKSSLIQRFITNSVPNNPQPTVGAFEHKHDLYLNHSAKTIHL